MSTAVVQGGRWRITGWHVLASIVTFFVVVMSVNVYFAVMAYRTFPGEVSSTPYEDGVAFNRHLADEARQDELGWRAALAESGADTIRIEIRDRAGAPVTGLSGVLRMTRPATLDGARSAKVESQGAGTYIARIGQAHGAWDAALTLADAQGRNLEVERRLVWR